MKTNIVWQAFFGIAIVGTISILLMGCCTPKTAQNNNSAYELSQQSCNTTCAIE